MMLARVSAMAQADSAAKIARGNYLMTIGACKRLPLAEARSAAAIRIRSGRSRAVRRPTPGRRSQTTTEIHASLDLTAWAVRGA